MIALLKFFDMQKNFSKTTENKFEPNTEAAKTFTINGIID